VGFITNGNISREFGFAQGFDHYLALPEEPESRSFHRDAADLREAATRWLAERTDESPFFLYLHASDPHAPYAPSSPHRERLVSAHAPALETIEYVREISKMTRSVDAGTAAQLKALYQAEVAHVDEQFGLLLDELEGRALLGDTIVVLTSDHGEEFYEHRWWQHGKTLYGEQLRIPLIIKLTSGRRARSDRLVEQIDLLPTLLAQVGLPVPDGVAGQDALSDGWHDRPALALLDRDGRHVESVVDGRFKLIDTHAYAHPLGRSPGVQLFDLRRDPAEQHNLAPQRPVRVGHLRTVMRRAKASVGVGVPPETIEIDAETRRTLRGLGYIE
jgi:arylsulfatase A-like enzyme